MYVNYLNLRYNVYNLLLFTQFATNFKLSLLKKKEDLKLSKLCLVKLLAPLYSDDFLIISEDFTKAPKPKAIEI